MNPQYPFPNPAFPPFNPLNPNPNFVNSNVSHFPEPQLNNRAPVLDLPSCLSSLKNLITASHSTLDSLTALSLSSKSLVQCPSNPHHWVPPNSLFLHTLHCPTRLDVGSLVDSLRYPKTLKSDHQLVQQNKFVQPLHDPTAELCFSLDDYVGFESNFFYGDCPGVVSCSLPNNDNTARMRIFTLPGVLSVECANFVGSSDGGSVGVVGICVKVLTSEIWGVGCEVERWGDFPNEYSYSVLKALLCLESVTECEVSRWVIVNSPRFGVVVDVPMRDHMAVLFRVCLRAIVREAARSYRSLVDRDVDDGGGGGGGGKFNLKARSFQSPVLVEVLKWLSSQLLILYGEANGKAFAIAMLKNLLPNAASRASLFPLDDKYMDQIAVNSNGQGSSSFSDASGKTMKNEEDMREDERIVNKAVFVYQIAAAIAALHERSLLEKRIKALRNPLPLTAYQRSVEHAHLSQKAEDERRKRPDYRPLIEHDGLPSHRQHDQDSNKAKTREELLAEERDYKRRRMSYRGKKLKRTKKEVMRDIIEEYMEAIKQAGGIGCLAKGDGGSMSTIKTTPAHDVINFKSYYQPASDQEDGCRRQRDEYTCKDTKPYDASSNRKERQEKDPYGHRHYEDQGVVGRNRHDRDYHSRSPTRDRTHSRSRESIGYGRNHGDKFPYSTSSSLSMPSGRKEKRKSESTDRSRHQRHRDDRSDFSKRDELSDRYDPAEASDTLDDQFNDSKYARPES